MLVTVFNCFGAVGLFVVIILKHFLRNLNLL